MNQMMILWIILLFVFIVLEALSMGLTTIWFAGGALAALIVEMLGGGVLMQVLIFLIVSLILLYFTRPIAMKYFNKDREKTNLDSLIGKPAEVTDTIHNLQGTGKVMVAGQEWSAKSMEDDRIFQTGETVTISAIQGVKLVVESEQKKINYHKEGE